MTPQEEFDALTIDPKFAQLSYPAQTIVRQRMFADKVMTDPQFALLDSAAKSIVAQRMVDAPPVLEQQQPSDYMLKAQSVVQKMQQGDRNAIGEAASLAAWRAGTKAMLLPTLATKGIDAVAQLFDPTQKDGLYHDYYGADGDKIGAWLEANVGRYGGEGATAQMNLGTGVIAGLGNIAEFIGTSLATGGLASGEFAATAAGRALAETKAFVGWGAMSKIAPRLAQTAVATGSMTLMDVGRRALQDELPSSGEFWNKIASDFGQNVAWDVIGWGIAKGTKTLMQSLLKTGRGFSTLPAAAQSAMLQNIDDSTLLGAFRTFSSEQQILKSLSPEYWQKLATDEGVYRASKIDPKGELGFAIGARSVGYETEFKAGGGIDFIHATDETKNFSVANRADGVRSLAELMTTGQAATFAPEAAVKNVAAAQSADSRLVRVATQQMSAELGVENAARLAVPQNGFYDAGGTQLLARSWLKAKGAPDSFVNNVKVALSDTRVESVPPMTIVLPRSAASVVGEGNFTKSLVGQLRVMAKKAGVALDEGEARSLEAQLMNVTREAPTSYSGVQALADKLRYEMKPIGGGKLQLERDGQTQIFDHAYQAQGALLDEAVRQGLVDDAQISATLQSRTGYELRKIEVPLVQGEEARKLATSEARAATELHYTLGKVVDDTFKQVDSAPSIGELLNRHPEMDFRMPSQLAPSTFIVDPESSVLTVKENFAVGTASQLLELGHQFADAQNVGNTIFSSAGKSVMREAKSTFRVVNDNLGVEIVLGDGAAAMKKLNSWNDDYVANVEALGLKGMKMTTLPDGSLAVYDGNGITERFASLNELQAWQRQRPMASWAAEMIPIAPDDAATAQREVAKAVSDADLKPLKRAPVREYASKAFLPTEASLVQMAKRSGNDSFLRSWRGGKSGFAMVESANARAGAVIHTIFRDTSKKERVIMNAVMSRPREEWQKFAQSAFNTTLSEKAMMRMDKLRSFLDEAFAASGNPDWKKQHNYMMRIKQFAFEHGDEVLDTDTAEQLIARAFPGGAPVGFSFFGSNLRATDLVQMATIEDAESATIAYVYALNKARYMDPIVKSMQDMLENEKGALAGYTKSDVKFMQDTLMTMQGASRTPAEEMWKLTSKSLAMNLQRIMKKIPGLKNAEIADEAFVGDVFDMLNRQMSLSTQATPWAMIRNIPQMTLLGGALHNQALVWQSFKEVIEEPASQTVNRVIRTGAVQDSLFSHGMQYNSDMNLWHRTMKWNENMDIASRATAFKVAEHLIDDNWTRLEKGLVTEQQFIKDSQLSIMDATAQSQLMSMLKAGDKDAAKYMYGDYLQRLCFFDYSQMQKPLLARGVLGKAYGRFMTYPAGTLALYQRILTSGDVGERLARSASIVLSSIAVYEAFKSVGIDYQGFLWSDPFGFSGGPLWSLLADGSQIVGTGPEAAMARQRLLTMLPKMLSPTAAMYQRVVKSMSWLDKGNVLSAAEALSGAPVRRDAAWAQLGL